MAAEGIEPLGQVAQCKQGRRRRPGAVGQPEITVNAVRYDDDPPWPALADGLGSSLQLIDPAQDNSRVANWTAAPKWTL